MAPRKFVAPARKDGTAGSFSFSSNSSIASNFEPKSNAPSRTTLQTTPSESGTAANNLKAAPRRAPLAFVEPNKRLAGHKSVKSAGKNERDDGPPGKKSKKGKSKAQESHLNGEGKENEQPQKPQNEKKAKEDGTKVPCKSLTDTEYNHIFQAVLTQYKSDDIQHESLSKADDAESDFQLSQSDLDDSEGEQSVPQHSPESVQKIPKRREDRQMNPSLTPTISCHSSKHDSIHNTDQGMSQSSLQGSGCSSQLEANLKEHTCLPEITLTPVSTNPRKTGITSPFLTPQKVSLKSSADPECPKTPSTDPRRPSSQSFPTPVTTNNRKPSKPQASQQSKNSQGTPNHSQPSTQVHQNSVDLVTPVSTPKKTASSDLALRSPLVRLGSSLCSTPTGSQQLGQEIQHTPPPDGLTARQRLQWLQKKRVTGVWVQCNEEECRKWRYMPDCCDPTSLPEIWRCCMHPDQELNRCSAEEQRLSLQEEEDMIFNKYSPGSLVWAKLPGYPWWPAMVEDDPDLEQFYWLNLFSDIPTWYHVVFFDGDRPATRAWVQLERLKDFSEELYDEDEDVPELAGFKKRVANAMKKASQAKQLSLEDRLAQYSFATCFKGPIGGPSKSKYIGPLGFRKSVTD